MMRCCRSTLWLSILFAAVLSAKTARLIGNLRRSQIENGGIKQNQLFHKGRHVCSQPHQVRRDVMTLQTYCRPTYRQIMRRCGYTFCPSFQLIYQIAYRKVFRTIQTVAMKYACCPGWTRNSLRENSCLIPQCSRPCHNGGRCSQPETCTCPKGYTGRTCEVDVNECKEPGSGCEHKCTNTQGSFVCQCYDGYRLQRDGRTCKLDIKTLPEYWEMKRKYDVLKQKMEDVQREMKQKTLVNMSQLMEELQKMQNVVGPTQQTTVPTTPKVITSPPITSTSPPITSTSPLPSSTRRTRSKIGTRLIEDQMDQLASLSDQIGLLEERLDDCACRRQGTAFYRQNFQELYVRTRNKRKANP